VNEESHKTPFPNSISADIATWLALAEGIWWPLRFMVIWALIEAAWHRFFGLWTEISVQVSLVVLGSAVLLSIFIMPLAVILFTLSSIGGKHLPDYRRWFFHGDRYINRKRVALMLSLFFLTLLHCAAFYQIFQSVSIDIAQPHFVAIAGWVLAAVLFLICCLLLQPLLNMSMLLVASLERISFIGSIVTKPGRFLILIGLPILVMANH